MSGFYFNTALTGNELSITNHEVHGVLNSFQHNKNKKRPCNLIGQIQGNYSESQSQLFRITKAMIRNYSEPQRQRSFLFQNPYC